MTDSNREPRQTDEEKEEIFIRERMERWNSSNSNRQQEFFDPFQGRPRKSKIVSGLLSFLIPGTGQLYLGLMQRGMTIMLLLILNIFAIVFFATNASSSIPLIVLFSLFVPVIYFYNIFDALQQTDRVNGQWNGLYNDPLDQAGAAVSRPFKKLSKGSGFGYLLVTAGVFLFLVSSKPDWLNRIFDMLGSSIGAVILIAVGVVLLFKEVMKK